jgi:predicted AlkP superfamily phosphohydrolase/phosphomutase
MSARHLVLGLDGADLEIVMDLGRARLPHLFALMDDGVFAHQRSVEPPATLPNWTTFLTGVDPGAHGVFDFTTRHGYRVRFDAGRVREVPTLASRLDRLGLRCACIGFPATFPPERLSRGVFMSGWDAPVAFEADRHFVHPPALHDTLTRRFGPLRFDEVDQFNADRPGFHARLGAQLVSKVSRRAELASFLLSMREWDLFAFYFGESDTASHYLWSLYDEGSPRRPKSVTPEEAAGLPRVYEALDAAVGRLVAESGKDVEVTIVSDHGSGGSSDKVLYLNRVLEQAGLLTLREPKRAAGSVELGKRLALERLSPRLRDRAFRFAGTLLPSLVESRVRYAGIDMAKTLAFSDELNYFPAVHLNVKGREPRGVVPAAELARVRREVEAALLALRDPDTGRAVVARVHPREELYRGAFVSRAPDLLLELNLDRGYSYNLMPSRAGDGHGVFRRLAPHEWLGKKGRSLPGSHRPRGLFIARGPSVRGRGQIDLSIADASAALCARLSVSTPEGARGTVPPGMLDARPVADLPPGPAVTRGRASFGKLEARLRALGYID